MHNIQHPEECANVQPHTDLRLGFDFVADDVVIEWRTVR
jgi:hypothetical protein